MDSYLPDLYSAASLMVSFSISSILFVYVVLKLYEQRFSASSIYFFSFCLVLLNLDLTVDILFSF